MALNPSSFMRCAMILKSVVSAVALSEPSMAVSMRLSLEPGAISGVSEVVIETEPIDSLELHSFAIFIQEFATLSG